MSFPGVKITIRFSFDNSDLLRSVVCDLFQAFAFLQMVKTAGRQNEQVPVDIDLPIATTQTKNTVREHSLMTHFD